MDSLSKGRYDSAMPIILWMPVGRFAAAPDDSLHLGHYGYPPKTLILDGDSVTHADEVPLPQYGTVFAGYIDIAKSTPTYAAIALDSASAGPDSGALLVRVTADSTPPGGQMRLLAVITEDSIVTGGLGTTWNRVARRVVPDYLGLELNLARGDTLYDTLRFSTAGLNPGKLKAAVFIQNASDWTIIQSLSVNRLTP